MGNKAKYSIRSKSVSVCVCVCVIFGGSYEANEGDLNNRIYL